MKKFMVIRQIEKNKFVELSGLYKTHEDALIEIKKWKKIQHTMNEKLKLSILLYFSK
jgi:hypothetical protein